MRYMALANPLSIVPVVRDTATLLRNNPYRSYSAARSAFPTATQEALERLHERLIECVLPTVSVVGSAVSSIGLGQDLDVTVSGVEPTLALIESAFDTFEERRREHPSASSASFDVAQPGWLESLYDAFLPVLQSSTVTFVKDTPQSNLRFALEPNAVVALCGGWAIGTEAAARVISRVKEQRSKADAPAHVPLRRMPNVSRPKE